MTSVSREFGHLVTEALDEALLVVGDEPRRAVYQYLSTMCSISREEIPERLEDFAGGMKKALGGASTVIQKIMLKKLFQKVGSSFKEAPDLDLVDYVKEAERRFEVSRQHLLSKQDATMQARSKKGQISG